MTATMIDLPVLGMTCAACVRRVERAIAALPGVATAEVNLALSRARIAGELDPAAVASAIRAAGYEVPADALDPSHADGAARLDAIASAHDTETAALRRDAILAIGLAIPLLVIAMVHVDGIAGVVAQLVLGTAIVLGPGRRYLRGGWIAVRHGSPDMNTLIAIGAGAAWLASAVTSIRWLAGARLVMPTLYFEAAGAIVGFVMIGKLLESRARAQVADAVRGLLSLVPARARLLVDGVERETDIAKLAPGDVIVVRPGERLAADGTVIAGQSAIDEAMLTGESLPVDKAEGSPAYAGTLNHHGALELRVARAGADTALARIVRAVEDAQGGKGQIARLADRVSAYFVPVVLAIGAATFVGWLLAGAGSGAALERAIAVLVIACPCALGLATPAAVAVGTARAAALGILFRGGQALEVASAIDIVCLDKTGTLTTGTPTLSEVVPVGDDRDGSLARDLLAIVASAEQGSEHPIARAIVDGARGRGLTLERPTSFAMLPGGGITARVGARSVRVGTREHLAISELDRGLEQRAHELAADGRTIAFVAVDDTLVGLVAVVDPPSADARQAIAYLRAQGIAPTMITGDREGAARWIAREVGIDRVHANVRPREKAQLVTAARDGGHRVAMVGDGINDTPALAAADLGIALASGADLAAAVADVTILRGGIAAVPVALALARATVGVIRRNLVAAFAYNAICIPVAAAGLLSPMVASAAMSLSSVSVLVLSLRLQQWKPSR